MPSKLRILAGSLLFWPHKNLIFSIRRHFSRGDGDSFAAEVCPFLGHSASRKGRSQDAHSAAQHRVSLRCAHGGRIVRLEPGQLSGRLSCKSRAHHSAQSPLWACARSTRACLLSSGDFFQSLRIGGDGRPVPSVATDCDVDLRVALPSIYPYR